MRVFGWRDEVDWVGQDLLLGDFSLEYIWVGFIPDGNISAICRFIRFHPVPMLCGLDKRGRAQSEPATSGACGLGAVAGVPRGAEEA